MKYLIWEHKAAGAQTVSQTELSFNTPRHGSASWLAKTGPLQGFDFVSPKAMMAGTVLLANPARIFEDLEGTVQRLEFKSICVVCRLLKKC